MVFRLKPETDSQLHAVRNKTSNQDEDDLRHVHLIRLWDSLTCSEAIHRAGAWQRGKPLSDKEYGVLERHRETRSPREARRLTLTQWEAFGIRHQTKRENKDVGPAPAPYATRMEHSVWAALEPPLRQSWDRVFLE